MFEETIHYKTADGSYTQQHYEIMAFVLLNLNLIS